MLLTPQAAVFLKWLKYSKFWILGTSGFSSQHHVHLGVPCYSLARFFNWSGMDKDLWFFNLWLINIRKLGYGTPIIMLKYHLLCPVVTGIAPPKNMTHQSFGDALPTKIPANFRWSLGYPLLPVATSTAVLTINAERTPRGWTFWPRKKNFSRIGQWHGLFQKWKHICRSIADTL